MKIVQLTSRLLFVAFFITNISYAQTTPTIKAKDGSMCEGLTLLRYSEKKYPPSTPCPIFSDFQAFDWAIKNGPAEYRLFLVDFDPINSICSYCADVLPYIPQDFEGELTKRVECFGNISNALKILDKNTSSTPDHSTNPVKKSKKPTNSEINPLQEQEEEEFQENLRQEEQKRFEKKPKLTITFDRSEESSALQIKCPAKLF